MHLFPCLSGLTGCGCLGIIIIISGWQFEPKLEPWLCAPDSSHFQLSSLVKRGVKQGGGWNKRLSRGLFITEISSTCTLYTVFKRSLYRHAKSSESIDKGTTVLLQSAQLCQVLVKINGTAEPGHSGQAVCTPNCACFSQFYTQLRFFVFREIWFALTKWHQRIKWQNISFHCAILLFCVRF